MDADERRFGLAQALTLKVNRQVYGMPSHPRSSEFICGFNCSI